MNRDIKFTLVYNRHKKQLYNYAMKMTRDKMVAEDITQSVFEKYFTNMHSIRNPELELQWLFSVARNLINMYFRSRKVRQTEDLEEVEISDNVNLPESMLESTELKQMLNSALDAMPLDFKEVYVLREYGGLSYEEIAATLGIDGKLVKSRIHNARRRLLIILSGKYYN